MRQLRFYLFLLYCFMCLSCKQSNQMITTDSTYETHQFGFSQAIVVNDFVFISGQVGWDLNHQLVDAENFELELLKAFDNLANIIGAANSSIDKIVLLRFYVKNLDSTKRQLIGRIINTYYPNDYKPASTLIGVETLARENFINRN